MIVLIVGGFSVWAPAAKSWRERPNTQTIELLAARNRVIATFLRGQVIGLFYDNEEVTTYGFAEKADSK